MSARTKQHLTKKKDNALYTVIIEIPGQKKRRSIVPAKHLEKLEHFLDKYAESEEQSITWDALATDRIAKYKKAGLVLRGARYRESLSQKELAHRSGLNQENISKMESGQRPIGEKVAKKLAKVLRIAYRQLLI